MSSSAGIRSWCPDIEPEARLQVERTARLPVLAGPVAVMPDAHWGMGATVGSVIPTRDAIIPAAVGVDIGCGMIAVRTDLGAAQLPDTLDKYLARLPRYVPAGVGQGHGDVSKQAAASLAALGLPRSELTDKQRTTLATQLGSLGSGNHFFEVCLDEAERVWVVLHSGSRGIGNQLAQKHIKLAQELCDAKLEDRDLAFFRAAQPEFWDYINDMLWAQDYAAENRALMMDNALWNFFAFVGAGHEVERINCHHNFTQEERHNGENVWITRKGAIKADVGDRGVIPGSMGTRSYIVSGLGNTDAYNSCSHGAGRRMSRGRAKQELAVGDLEAQMEGKVWQRGNALGLLDEAPGAYKDIDVVMENQKDLVRVDHTLSQILNYKGQ